MKKYELVIILDGKTTPAKAKAFTEKLEKLVVMFKGKLGKSEEWGKKELASIIDKNETGYFLIFPLELETLMVKAINDKLRLEDEVIRYMIKVVEE